MSSVQESFISLSAAARAWNTEHPKKNEKLIGKNEADLKTAGLGKTVFASYKDGSWKFIQLGCFQRVLLWLGLCSYNVKLNKEEKDIFLKWRNKVRNSWDNSIGKAQGIVRKKAIEFHQAQDDVEDKTLQAKICDAGARKGVPVWSDGNQYRKLNQKDVAQANKAKDHAVDEFLKKKKELDAAKQGIGLDQLPTVKKIRGQSDATPSSTSATTTASDVAGKS